MQKSASNTSVLLNEESSQLSGLECGFATSAPLKARGFKLIMKKVLEMLEFPGKLQFYFTIGFFKIVFWLYFQIRVLSIIMLFTGLLTILTFLITAIRFQSNQLNCCCFQQVYLAAVLILWS